MRIFVIGDIHAQAAKFWHILSEAGVAHNQEPTDSFLRSDTKLILLGDLVHAKSRERYAQLTDVPRYDEFNPRHVEKAEQAQEAFLLTVKSFYDKLPDDKVAILMGNHDYNAVHYDQGPLRTEDVAHLEWKDITGNKLPEALQSWMLTWSFEKVIDDIHFAHVGPLPKHNTYDNDFYLENRRRWIYEEKDYIDETPYRLGVYGHTPVRGGVNIASQGHAILLDTNGHGDEYSYLEISVNKDSYHLKMRGLFFDEKIQR